jgi:ribosomal protein S18 acetylase RimI-like enzyme
MVSPNEIVVRHATPSDKVPAERLVKQVFPDDPYAYAANIFLPNECINVVAESSPAGVVGFTSLLLDPTPHLGPEEWKKYPLYIGVIVVDARYRRLGTGFRMLDLLSRTALERRPQYNCLHLHVLQNNEPGIKFFEQYGFQRIGETKPNNAGVCSWLMRKAIR